MHKPTIGLHKFRPRATEECPCPCEELALVCGLNEDGTANVLVLDSKCDFTSHQNAVLVQATEDCPCHYTEPEPACDPDEQKEPTDGEEIKGHGEDQLRARDSQGHGA